ncbi:MAG: cobalamin-binding protein [Candidatus Cloacimonetes bacterium]|nr:cobalamin-binding protein [Candidatus Cloacimonadota bacterium]
MRDKNRFGILKPSIDAHTLGIVTISQILEQCDFNVIVGDQYIEKAVDNISHDTYFKVIENWILDNHLSHLGFSYRLDPIEGVELFNILMYKIIKSTRLLQTNKNLSTNLYFAGLKSACDKIEELYNGKVRTFIGDERIDEVIAKFNIPESKIPKAYIQQSQYDKILYGFSQNLISKELHHQGNFSQDYHYPEYGTFNDSLIKRLSFAQKVHSLPLIRCHVGPYLKNREEALTLFSEWLKDLSKSGLLDIVSVGSSQLSQSHFGEDWGDRPNGGGVPINSELDLKVTWECSLPMLVRSYSGTNNVPKVAQILEENLNMAWHALSLWWFNQLDGRGSLSLKENLKQHIHAMQYISSTGKPFEPNVPHHFSFRGSDDLTYIASAYFAAKMAKKLGIQCLILQNMLNIPKYTTGIIDLIRSRALLKIVRSLEDKNFIVILQPRAGLNYFSPDIEKAKIQLGAVSALMSDIEYRQKNSPQIVHVVSYSEALYLADPQIIKDSIKITKSALLHYPLYRESQGIKDFIDNNYIHDAVDDLVSQVRILISNIEESIPNIYSVNGFFEIFKNGYFPVPFLWRCRDEFPNALCWKTKLTEHGTRLINDNGEELRVARRLEKVKELNEVNND